MNTTQSPKTATDSSGPRGGNLLTKAQHLWYHPVDKKHSFFHVEFEVLLRLFLRENSCPTKSDIFHGVYGPSFFSKRGVLKIRQLLGFINWRISETHGACVNRVQKTNEPSQIVRDSTIHAL
jgi:hypothetical protein